MIRIFRHIRKKLIEQDNVRKYLLYAIGEILLVVIGILIALQVNNWNEGRKQALQNRQYLTTLSAEIENNIETLTAYKKKLKEQADSTYYYLELVNGDIKPSGTTIDQLTGEVGPIFSIAITKSVISKLSGSGILESIQDEELKRLLPSITKSYENFEKSYAIANDHWINLLRPYYNKHGDLLKMYSKTSRYKLPESGYSPDINSFYKNRYFSGILSIRLLNNKNLDRTTTNVITNLESVNAQIQNFLIQ